MWKWKPLKWIDSCIHTNTPRIDELYSLCGECESVLGFLLLFSSFPFATCLSQQQWYGNTLVGRLGIIKLLLQTDNVHRLYACVANDWDCCRFALSCFFYCTHRLMHSKCVLAMDILLTSTGWLLWERVCYFYSRSESFAYKFFMPTNTNAHKDSLTYSHTDTNIFSRCQTIKPF